MSEMTALEYLKTKARMTNNCTISCKQCYFHQVEDLKEYTCFTFQTKHPEKAIEIVKKWAEENPVKTYMSYFFEKFPNALKDEDNGQPLACVEDIYGEIPEVTQGCLSTNCLNCWKREYKEEGNDGK